SISPPWHCSRILGIMYVVDHHERRVRLHREEVTVDIHIHVLYLVSVLLLWLATYHIAYWIAATARDPGLVGLSVGPFGVSTISLREPPARRVLAQFVFAAAVLAAVTYASLFIAQPPPIAGLDRAPTARLVVVAIPVVALSATRLLGVIRDRLY